MAAAGLLYGYYHVITVLAAYPLVLINKPQSKTEPDPVQMHLNARQDQDN